MAITAGTLAVDEPTTIDKRADCNSMTRATLTVQREVVSVGSPDDTLTENIASVSNADPGSGGMGMTVRNVNPTPAGTANIGDVDVLTMPNVTVLGNKSNNGGAPGATNLGTLPAVATSAAPSYTEGNQAGLSVNLSGQQRVAVENSVFENLEQLNAVDLASPFDVDSGAGTQNVIGVSVRKAAAGGSVEYGTSTDPIRTDPTGTTTQPVSGTVTANGGTSPSLANSWNVRITDTVDSAGVTAAGALQVDGSAVTQPVSGTVTANQGTPAVTANRWPVQITDGTDLALVSAAGALLVDGSAVTQPVSGTVTVQQTTAANLNAEVQGDAAHNAALSGNPVRIGVRANAAQLAAVTDGVTTDLIANRHGELRVAQGAPAASVLTNVNFPAVNTRASSTRAAGAAGVRHVLKGLTAVLAGGTTAPAAVQIPSNLSLWKLRT